QTETRSCTLERDVPSDAIYKVYHMCGRLHEDFYATDLLSDILSNGKSARLYTELVQKQKIFSEINAYISGENDPGLFVISGNIMPGHSMEDAEKSINQEINKITQGFVFDYELQKVTNKVESTIIFSESSILQKAMNLARFELLDRAEMIHEEIKKYASVSSIDINRVAQSVFRKENESTLYYLSNTIH